MAALALPDMALSRVPVEVTAATGASLGTDGFLLDYFVLGAGSRFGDHALLTAVVEADLDGVELNEAIVRFEDMPLNLGIRIGRFRTRFGLANERHLPERWISDTPLMLDRTFGPGGHQVLGLDVVLEIPAPWTLRVWSGMSEAGGVGQRSAFGTAAPRIDGPEDFAFLAGIQNRIEVDEVRIAFDLHGVFAPNPSGRSNGTDVFGASLGITWRPDPDDLGVGFETEWMLRRRQIIGDALQDFGGWAQAMVWIDETWSVGARWDYTSGLEADDLLDPDDLDDRYRAHVQVEWSPHEGVGVRLQGTADAGGPHADPQFGGMIYVRAGWSRALVEDVE